jgi:hypothetical protein
MISLIQVVRSCTGDFKSFSNDCTVQHNLGTIESFPSVIPDLATSASPEVRLFRSTERESASQQNIQANPMHFRVLEALAQSSKSYSKVSYASSISSAQEPNVMVNLDLQLNWIQRCLD